MDGGLGGEPGAYGRLARLEQGAGTLPGRGGVAADRLHDARRGSGCGSGRTGPGGSGRPADPGAGRAQPRDASRGDEGARASLTALDDGDLRVTTGFRSVYGTLLERVLDTGAGRVLGGTRPALGFL